MIQRSEGPIKKLALGVAALGGLVLVALAILSGINIIGRAFLWAGLKPIRGDVELIEAGVAFAVAAFMPWCQLQRGHASVTIISDLWNVVSNSVIDLISDVFLTLIAALLLWRHVEGMLDKIKYNETTFILQFPLWWAYAGMVLGLVAWIIVGLWTIFADIAALRRGEARDVDGAVH